MSGKITLDQMKADPFWTSHGSTILPDDHPIYSEGPTIMMVSRSPKRVKPVNAETKETEVEVAEASKNESKDGV